MIIRSTMQIMVGNSTSNAMKQAMIDLTNPVGTMTQDRRSGIMIVPGVAPITTTVTTALSWKGAAVNVPDQKLGRIAGSTGAYLLETAILAPIDWQFNLANGSGEAQGTLTITFDDGTTSPGVVIDTTTDPDTLNPSPSANLVSRLYRILDRTFYPPSPALPIDTTKIRSASLGLSVTPTK